MNLLKVSILLTLLGLIGGCSTVAGDFSPKSHFVFPNSNLKAAGPASASMKKVSFFTPPTVSVEEVNALLKQARKKSNADLIIDYSVDTTVTSFMFYYEMEITLAGTGATMDIGKQKLMELDYYQ